MNEGQNSKCHLREVKGMMLEDCNITKVEKLEF